MAASTESKIIEIMENQTVISISELASRLSRSEMTVRRNLDILQDHGFIIRKRGYAVLQKKGQATNFHHEQVERTEEKSAIAKAALHFIRPGSSVCFDSGTTTQKLVESFPDKNIQLSVITPSLTIAETLSTYPEVQVYMPEGCLHHSNLTLLFSSEEVLRNLRADIAFMACRSFKPSLGTFENTPTMRLTKHALSKIADQTVLLLDYSKWNNSALCSTIALHDIDVIITDNKAPQEEVLKCADTGKKVIVVDPSSERNTKYYNF